MNKALRSAGMEGGVVGGKGLKGVWQGRINVFGRPTSAASYLHLAGRVGRAMSADVTSEGTEEVEIRPGTVVSFCSKGRVTELEKCKNQIGATELDKIELLYNAFCILLWFSLIHTCTFFSSVSTLSVLRHMQLEAIS